MIVQHPVRELFTHWNPHAEEIFAIFLAHLFGEEFFPGIRKALVKYVDAGSFFPDADLQLPMLQRLYLGSGGGRFDEHAHPGLERKTGCAATLFAEALGVRNRLGVKKLLDYLEREDLQGNTKPFELPALIKARHPYNKLTTQDELDQPLNWALLAFNTLFWAEQEGTPLTKEYVAQATEDIVIRWISEQQANFVFPPGDPRSILRTHPYLQQLIRYIDSGRAQTRGFHPYSFGQILALHLQRIPDKPDVVYRWAREILDVKLKEQLDYFAAESELNQNVRYYRFTTERGRQLLLAAIESDNAQMGKWVRTLYGNGSIRIDILVLRKKSTGHTQIFTDKRSNVSLDDAARLIRIHEQIRLENRLSTVHWDELIKEGQVAGARRWHYFRQAGMFLNGTFTSPNTLPTPLSLTELCTYIEWSFNKTYMETIVRVHISQPKPLS
jgi:hypothetical protein